MSMLTPLNITKLSQAEFIQFMISTVDALDVYKSEHSDRFIHSLTDSLVQELPRLKEALSRKQGSVLTKELNTQIKERDAEYQTLLTGLRFHKRTRDVEKAKAYQLISGLVNQYKCPRRTNRQESFILISELLEKLEASETQAALQLLNLEETVAILKECHSKAYQIFFKRNQEVSDKVQIDWKPIRKKMQQQYRLLTTHIVNQVLFDPTVPEGKLLMTLNNIRQTYANLNRSKQSNKEQQEGMSDNLSNSHREKSLS